MCTHTTCLVQQVSCIRKLCCIYMHVWLALKFKIKSSTQKVRHVNYAFISLIATFAADMLYDRSSTYDFFSISKDLEPPGLLLESKKYKFKFNAVDKAHETYSGINVRLRYFVRLTIHRNYARWASFPCLCHSLTTCTHAQVYT